MTYLHELLAARLLLVNEGGFVLYYLAEDVSPVVPKRNYETCFERGRTWWRPRGPNHRSSRGSRLAFSSRALPPRSLLLASVSYPARQSPS